MDKFLLRIILGFVHFFVKKDVDFDRLKIIAETKVLMDRRRTPANFKRKQQKDPQNPLFFTLLMYGFLGLFMAAIMFSPIPMLVTLASFHGYILFMMAMTLVTDFSSVLLDTTDNQIILPTPVTSRTIFLARVVHILVYLLQFTIALTIFPVIAIFINFGVLTGIVSLLMVFLTVAFSVFVTYLLYALILRFANEQKLKDIISYFQIFMTIFFAVGFQVIPRLINFKDTTFTLHLHWYSYLAPPVWMASATEAFHDLNFDTTHLLMIACAVIIPIVTVWMMIQYLAPSFAKKLNALSNNPESTQTTGTSKVYKKDLSERLSPLVCSTSVVSIGFEKVWKITGRDKNFKMQFYPSLAYLFVFAFIFVFKSGKNIHEIWVDLPSTNMFLWFVYLPMFSISSCLAIVAFYDNFGAAWIYQSSPLTKPGEIISGMLQALLLKFFVPIYLLLFAFALFVWGPLVIDDFVFGFFNNTLIFLLMANFSDHYLPFSRQANIKVQSGKFIRMILQLMIVGVLIGIHWFALKIFWLPAALIPVSAIGAYLLLKRIQQLPWLKISI